MTASGARVDGSFSATSRRGRVLFVGAFLPTTVASRSASEDLAERIAAAGWQVVLTSRRRSKSLRLLDLLASITREAGGCELAHVDLFSGRAFGWGALATRLLALRRVPTVLTLHGGGLPDYRRRHPRRVAAALARAAAVVAPSPWLARELGENDGAITVIPNGMDLASYCTAAPLEQVSRPAVVWVRAFEATYRPELAVETLAALREPFPGATLTMVGADKGALAATRQRARELGVGPALTLLGGIPKAEVPARIAAGEVFLSTSAVDNAPVTVVEAMASGRPVVAARVGGLADLLEDGVEGLLVEGNAEALAAAIRRLAGDPLLVRRLADGGRRRVAGHDWSAVLPRWLQLFERARRAP